VNSTGPPTRSGRPGMTRTPSCTRSNRPRQRQLPACVAHRFRAPTRQSARPQPTRSDSTIAQQGRIAREAAGHGGTLRGVRIRTKDRGDTAPCVRLVTEIHCTDGYRSRCPPIRRVCHALHRDQPTARPRTKAKPPHLTSRRCANPPIPTAKQLHRHGRHRADRPAAGHPRAASTKESKDHPKLFLGNSSAHAIKDLLSDTTKLLWAIFGPPSAGSDYLDTSTTCECAGRAGCSSMRCVS